MQRTDARGLLLAGVAAVALAVVQWLTSDAHPACCYFAAKGADIQQPAQKVFITWDELRKEETFTVQPKFVGNAKDFGMIVPTPGKPSLDPMPRDLFQELAVYTLLTRREYPESSLLASGRFGIGGGLGALGGGFGALGGGLGALGGMAAAPRPPAVRVLQSGTVGTLEYKTLSAGRADDLYGWLRDNRYHYAGDEATLDFYVKKGWFFTVMKIDPMQMKQTESGTYTGEITPTRFKFPSEELIYPLRITRLSVKEETEALFYVQSLCKVDLPGDLSYEFQWIPLLQSARPGYKQGSIRGLRDLPAKAGPWLDEIKDAIPGLLARGEELGFGFAQCQRPRPNKDGRTPATLEWARKLTVDDIQVLKGEAAFSEQVPNVDAGIGAADFANPRTTAAAQLTIQQRLAISRKEHPAGYQLREAPEEDVRQLKILVGHLQPGLFLTKFRKTFTRGEMDDDLRIVPAKVGRHADWLEYTEILPTSPP